MKTTTTTEENYLRAIYLLSMKSEVVSTGDLATEIQTTPASVTDMLKKLNEKQLAVHKPYRGVYLTHQGEEIAYHLVRKQQLWEYFLSHHLKLDDKTTKQASIQLALVRSDEMYSALDAFLEFPMGKMNGKAVNS